MRNDPTANQAIGAVCREWRQMRQLARQIQVSRDAAWADRQRERFTGIFRRLLDDPEEVGAGGDRLVS